VSRAVHKIPVGSYLPPAQAADLFLHVVKSSMLSSQRDPAKIRPFFHQPSLRYAT
jgi:hypothetical protein